jgi:threonylcarbamoyladenosine tRNA methylthiotransferase MtaB
VLCEVNTLIEGGCREIVLTGIETGSYGADFQDKYRLSDLIAELDMRRSAERIRLGSLAPELIRDDFISVAKVSKSLMPHFHLSLQSGSDAVLRLMKRRYNRARAMETINRLREAIPRATFTTDLMVGFPGETEEDFLSTVSFVREARFLDAHVFAYSKRHGTAAIDYPNQVPEDIKRRRSEELIRAVAEVREEVMREILSYAYELPTLFEEKRDGMWYGHSDNFVPVSVMFDGELHGEVMMVEPIELRDGVIIGKIKKR